MDTQNEADRRMIKPLEGIRVVDLSRALAGPYCTALLADMGAHIIKVESLNGGDIARQWSPSKRLAQYVAGRRYRACTGSRR
jgi:crotonobetainyl-CoA:carnitine CoA-transferase CaiB-like acyl-CoA transferase